MNHEIYVFGSITRGEVSSTSDTDVLVIPFSGQAKDVYPPNWSYYTKNTLQEMHADGRLFSWHLHLDSKCVYTPRDIPLLVEMGSPNPYRSATQDIDDLKGLLEQAIQSLLDNTPNPIYELGVIHTCLRDIAMSASWYLSQRPCFSIYAPYKIDIPFPLDMETYKYTISARHNSTRGHKMCFNWQAVTEKILSAPIGEWVLEVQENMHEFVC